MVMGVAGEPTWIETAHGALAAAAHAPTDGRATGCVVLVPAIGHEQLVARPSWVILARRLAEAGLAVVRFDLSGEGDSTPLLGNDPITTWLADLDAAIDLAARLVPGVPVQGVGLRLGASLLAASDNPVLGSRLLWEPVSGADFVREQLARRACVMEPIAPGMLELVGLAFDPAARPSLEGLPAPAADDVRALVEENREVARRHYDVGTMDAVIPRASIERIVAAQPHAEARAVVDVPPVLVAHSIVGGRRIREELVTVGPFGLTGVLSEPDGVCPDVSVGLWAGGCDPKSGAVALWTQLARELAADGARCLRTDRRGVGEHVDPGRDTPSNPYSTTGIADAVDACRWLQDRGDQPVVAIGHSAAAWTLARAAALTDLAGVVLVNNRAWDANQARYSYLDFPVVVQESELQPAQQDGSPQVGVKQRVVRQVERVWPGVRTSCVPAECKALVTQGVPAPVWDELARRGRVMDVRPLLTDIPVGTGVTVVADRLDAAVWRQSRGPRAIGQMGQQVTYDSIGGTDHVLHSAAKRRVVVDLLVGHVRTIRERQAAQHEGSTT